tara:strand:+ start:245 stop:1036 length:792 start_codon:yes stop_codon:yes gene_type:complete
MIKFFRKLRQRLLTENKFSKYLLYALGEILLVVIGILIALSINNWNENSKNERLETNYLIRISKNLDNDFLEFDDAIKLAQERNNRVLFLQEALENPELVQDSSDYFVQSIITAGYTYIPVISNHSFEELKSSGRLALIQNEELRVLIAKYYDFVFGSSQWDFLKEDVQLKYNEYSRGILNQDQLNWVLNNYYSPDYLSNISKTELDGIYQRFVSRKEFHSILPQVFEGKYNTMQVMHNSKRRAEYLKSEIQDELNGNSNLKK